MDIILYTTPDIKQPTNNKTLTSLGTISGQLKNNTSIMDPVIKMGYNYSGNKPNYAYIPEFARYYFINDVVYMAGQMTELHMHVDVLQTYSEAIASCTGIVTKTTLSAQILNGVTNLTGEADVIQNPGVACGAKTMFNSREFPGAPGLESSANWILTVLG